MLLNKATVLYLSFGTYNILSLFKDDYVLWLVKRNQILHGLFIILELMIKYLIYILSYNHCDFDVIGNFIL